MKTPLTIAIMMLSFAGCRTTSAPAPIPPASDSLQRYQLSFFDDNTQMIAADTIDLPRVWPLAGQRFGGQWRLKSAGSSFPSDATHNGTYSGFVDNHSVSIDLNPGVSEHNVMLSGDLARAKMEGDWLLTNVGGGKPMGKFSLSR